MSWAPEVMADHNGTWNGGALRFATRAEAEEYVLDLSCRWTAVYDRRVVESLAPVNSRWIDGRLEEAVAAPVYYAIRQVSTGWFMPEYGTRKGLGGYTNDKPAPPSIRPPRLFLRKRDAAVALRHWLRGVTSVRVVRSGGPTWGDEDTELLATKPVAGRDAVDMEIVAVQIVAGLSTEGG